MEWFLSEAYPWFERNATVIAAIEFVILIISAPATTIGWWLMGRTVRRHFEKVEERADVRHRELLDLRSVLGRVKMKPRRDGRRVGQLPNLTNIVEMPDGQILLALPVRMVVDFVAAVGGSASLGQGTVDE